MLFRGRAAAAARAVPRTTKLEDRVTNQSGISTCGTATVEEPLERLLERRLPCLLAAVQSVH
jgi:hypothetical protein